MRRLCVYCGSRAGRDPGYAGSARDLARALAARGIGLVYGGGEVGMMGALADAALAAGVEVTGVIPHALVAREQAHRGLPDLRVVASMHERKALMADLADGFVALPGGLGTLEELFEAFTWIQLGVHAKPLGLLDAKGYFDPLLAFLDRTVEAGFVSHEHRALLVVEARPDRLLDRLAAWEPPAVERWLDPAAT